MWISSVALGENFENVLSSWSPSLSNEGGEAEDLRNLQLGAHGGGHGFPFEW